MPRYIICRSFDVGEPEMPGIDPDALPAVAGGAQHLEVAWFIGTAERLRIDVVDLQPAVHEAVGLLLYRHRIAGLPPA